MHLSDRKVFEVVLNFEINKSEFIRPCLRLMIPELFHSVCILSLLSACTHFDSSCLSPNTNSSGLL